MSHPVPDMVVRDCICPLVSPAEGHTPECSAAFKAKLWGRVAQLRHAHDVRHGQVLD